MPRQAEAEETTKLGEVRGEKLDPIRVVRRVLTGPDGSKVVAEVPVYPPFRLPDRANGRMPPRGRSAPSLKRKRSGSASGTRGSDD